MLWGIEELHRRKFESIKSRNKREIMSEEQLKLMNEKIAAAERLLKEVYDLRCRPRFSMSFFEWENKYQEYLKTYKKN